MWNHNHQEIIINTTILHILIATGYSKIICYSETCIHVSAMTVHHVVCVQHLPSGSSVEVCRVGRGGGQTAPLDTACADGNNT